MEKRAKRDVEYINKMIRKISSKKCSRQKNRSHMMKKRCILKPKSVKKKSDVILQKYRRRRVPLVEVRRNKGNISQ